MLHSKHNALSEDEFIAQINKDFDDSAMGVLHACETVYMNGFSDQWSGDVDTYGHFYRVHRWIVWTDSQGFHDLETYDSEDEAIKAFEAYDKEYSATFDTEDCF